MSYQIAAIDVHKKMLAVVVADVSGGGEYQFQRRKFGATPDQLQLLAEWLVQLEVEEVVMESTAQYWKPVWGALERHWQPERRKRDGASKMSGTLHLCLARSNRGRRGRKNDFLDGERMIKRLVAQELDLSYVPSPEQRLWRTVTRGKHQLTCDRVRFQNQLESFLEQGHIKLSSFVSDLLGISARRMLYAIAEGESNPAKLAAMADHRLRASQEQLRDALGACADLPAAYRRLLKMELKKLELIEEQMDQLDREIAILLEPHQEAVQRLAEIPGLGVNSAMQIIAEVGPEVAAFPSAKELSSWVGVCPGDEVSADQSKSTHSPKGNRQMRRLLNQAAHAAVKVKGSIFEVKFNQLRLRPRIEYKGAIWAVAHRICRVVWLILRRRVRYQEHGPAVSAKSKRTRTARMIKELQKLGYHIEGGPLTTGAQA